MRLIGSPSSIYSFIHPSNGNIEYGSKLAFVCVSTVCGAKKCVYMPRVLFFLSLGPVFPNAAAVFLSLFCFILDQRVKVAKAAKESGTGALIEQTWTGLATKVDYITVSTV